MGRNKVFVLTEVVFTEIADKGRCIGKAPEGQTVFVSGAVPGDIADVMVIRKKKGYCEGVVQRFVKFSEARTTPFCEHFGTCGGCKWQNLDYAAQLAQKEMVARGALERIGKVRPMVQLPILGAPETRYYRNKLEFSFSCKRWLTRDEIAAGVSNAANVAGFHPAGGFDKVIDIRECHLQAGPSNQIRNTAREIGIRQGLTFYDTPAHKGLLRTLMLRTTMLGQVMALVSFGEDQPRKIKAFLDALLEENPQITTLLYCVNLKQNDTVHDLEMHIYYGPGYVEEILGGVRFHIGPKSFFQTNTRQAEALYETARDFAALQGQENVYDLYSGIGSIALFLSKYCRQAVGIEEIGAAVEDARKNAELNGIDNVLFYAGDVKNILTQEFAGLHGRPDLLVTDPPRAGMHPDVVGMLLELAPPKIVYISCNPATQARDLNALSEKYETLKARAVDMFPHTHHIENVALLQLRAI
ncbi:MAG: 23S rRNA (uracil(1939)-C(5))-methyltransferase RlmD [Saprospiraceae bacterium]|jgi:23S rRNA (uracil1939-C5)-methyltransferase